MPSWRLEKPPTAEFFQASVKEEMMSLLGMSILGEEDGPLGFGILSFYGCEN